MNSNEYKRIILTQMSPHLKPAGFRKTNNLFSAEEAEVVLFIQLQSSLKTTKHFLVATVNLGIFSLKVAERVGNTRAPNILDAHWRERIGRFTQTGSDKWWEIDSEQKAHVSGHEILSVLMNRALPHMRSLASTESLESLWQTGYSPGITDYERQRFIQALDSAQRTH